MTSAQPIELLLITAIALVLLSIFTVFHCKNDKPATNDAEFLFAGKDAAHSLASSAGSIFSISVFFGGAMVYGAAFKGWFIVGTALGAILAVFAVFHLLARFSPPSPEVGKSKHFLLHNLHDRLAPTDFNVLIWFYGVLYFALLVEEITLVRLLFYTLFPSFPIAAALMTATMLIVLYLYVQFGGFKAILSSDYVQTIILVVFMCALFYLCMELIARPEQSIQVSGINTSVTLEVLALFTLPVFVFGWIVGSLDYHSRLSFRSGSTSPSTTDLRKYAGISIAIMFLILATGAIGGILMFRDGAVWSAITPTSYGAYLVSTFLNSSTPLLFITLAVALFCAAFTTLDTLLFSFYQLSFFNRASFDRTRAGAFPLLAASIVAAAVEFEKVISVWFFTVSLFVIPASIAILVTFHSGSLSRLKLRYLLPVWVAVSLSSYSFVHSRVMLSYDLHLLIPLTTILPGILGAVVALVFFWVNEKKQDAEQI